MSCAKPIIATDAAGNTLAVADGVNGLIVPEQDPLSLAQTIARLAGDADERQRMGAASRQRIETELVEEITVEQFPRMEGRQMVMMIAPKKH